MLTGGTLAPESIMIMWEGRLSHFCVSQLLGPQFNNMTAQSVHSNDASTALQPPTVSPPLGPGYAIGLGPRNSSPSETIQAVGQSVGIQKSD